MKPIHLYGAVLLLLFGYGVLSTPERIQAAQFNKCVKFKQKVLIGYTDPERRLSSAVIACN